MQHNHSRAHIRLNNQAEAMAFVGLLSELPDRFAIENKDGSSRVDAKSIIGLIYFMLDLNDEMYLVNETHDGVIPASVDTYRIVA